MKFKSKSPILLALSGIAIAGCSTALVRSSHPVGEFAPVVQTPTVPQTIPAVTETVETTTVTTQERALPLIESLNEELVFGVGSAHVDANAVPTLKELARAMGDDSSLKILVLGHTDSTGPRKLNEKLSEKRAAAVRRILIENGAPDQNVRAESIGERQPTSSNINSVGRRDNRRAELKLID